MKSSWIERLLLATVLPTFSFGFYGCVSLNREKQSDPSGLLSRTFLTDGMEEDSAQGRMVKGRLFLKQNALQEGVEIRRSGLQFVILEEGDGVFPQMEDVVVTHYKVRNIDGQLLDDSEGYGEPQEFRMLDVIEGWREALQEMKVGSKWRLFVPPDLVFGSRGLAQIPGGEILIYDLSLLGVQRGKVGKENRAVGPHNRTGPLKLNGKSSFSGKRSSGGSGFGVRLDNLDLID